MNSETVAVILIGITCLIFFAQWLNVRAELKRVREVLAFRNRVIGEKNERIDAMNAEQESNRRRIVGLNYMLQSCGQRLAQHEEFQTRDGLYLALQIPDSPDGKPQFDPYCVQRRPTWMISNN